MPVKRKSDNEGPYYQWGDHGKKYRYIPNNKKSRNIAKKKAIKQGIAVHATGWHE